jgi:hypothetical protein
LSSLEDLIDRYLIIAAIDSNNIEVFQKFADVVPSCVKQDLGMNGDPLNQAIWRTTWELNTPQQAIDLASFLLKNGADPNGWKCRRWRWRWQSFRSSLDRRLP